MWQVGEIPNYEDLLKYIAVQLEFQNELLVGIASLLHSDQSVTLSQNHLTGVIQNLDSHDGWSRMREAIDDYNKYTAAVRKREEEANKQAEEKVEEDEASEEPEPDKENGT